MSYRQNKTEIKYLETDRSLIKYQLNNFKMFIEDIADDKYIQLSDRIAKATELWEKFDNIQTQLERLDDKQRSERFIFEDDYFETVAIAKKLLNDFNSSNLLSQTDSISHSFHVQNTSNSNSIKLPPISLPNFDGKYEQWVQFHDTFRSLIHLDTSLSDMQKLFYLKSCLKGEAAEILGSLEITDNNYLIAWNLLKDRYEHKRLITQNHIKALFEMQPMTKESLPLLRKLQDDVKKNIRALTALGQPTDKWDSLLIYLISSKLDSASKREWEKLVIERDYTTLDKLFDFLTQRCHLLEAVQSDKKDLYLRDKSDNFKNRRGFRVQTHDQGVRGLVASTEPNGKQGFACYLCKGSHALIKCRQFLEFTPKMREREVKRMKLCLNCLRASHSTPDCISGGCRKCNKKHNSLLHQQQDQNREETGKLQCDKNEDKDNNQNNEEVSKISSLTSVMNYQINSASERRSEVLLSTAVVSIFDKYNQPHDCRLLMDSASQANFISTSMCQLLNLDVKKIKIPVVGINQTVTNTSYTTEARIKSKFNNFEIKLPLIVIDNISGNLPTIRVNKEEMHIPKHIILADEMFDMPRKIDLLIGATIFYELLCVGQIKLAKEHPVIQKTKLGWIISGAVPGDNRCKKEGAYNTLTMCNFSTISIQDQIEKFWKLEEVSDCKSRLYSREEQECEDCFVKTTVRLADGRFGVRLPVKENIEELGDSFATAERQFLQLERRFRKNSNLKNKYVEFIQEYLDMGHMTKVKNHKYDAEETIYYMPHHGVIKEDSVTTKLRVVFNASQRTSSGLSLNDKLKVGPTLQDDLFMILIRFRRHDYVLTSDIAKMYRMVSVQQDQRNLQRILWRFSEDKPIEKYQLNTVTYGTSCASYLAIRSLRQAAYDNLEKYPTACEKILSDFYVDDLITSVSTFEEAEQLRNEITDILQAYGFVLRKWKSNEPKLLSNFSESKNNIRHFITEGDVVKTLGLTWDSSKDTLRYSVNKIETKSSVTKRNILSIIAQVFDPLGLLGPCIIKAKIIMQQLWQLGLEWDESVPLELYSAWSNLQSRLQDIDKLVIPRQAFCTNAVSFQLHGFSDASEMAYAACIYVRSTNSENEHFTCLLTAKSRVAPLKKVTLPKLELCGALLLTRLMEKVSKALKRTTESVFYHTDSTIVLAWISMEPHLLKTFVANRVVEIQQLTSNEQWKHVNGIENPADILTRGLNPEQLAVSQLWWNGPQWLSQHQEIWPKAAPGEHSLELPEVKLIKTQSLFIKIDENIFERHSSFLHMQRVIAYVKRFVNNARVTRSFRLNGSLTVEEIQSALKYLIKLAQYEEFSLDIKSLIKDKKLHSTSKLLSLCPFLDKDGILRVGGRLHKGDLPFDTKHQIILPSKHKLTKLIVEYEHRKNLHAGPGTLLAIIRQQFWPISGKNLIRKILRHCLVCFKTRPVTYEHLMGDLPKDRITPSRAFNVCGIDYAGPFDTKASKLKQSKIIKSYVCIFVCFATKAIHIEVVSDLTTDSFLNCLKRFISRRGKPAQIYSDNGSNFIGAKNVLYDLFKFLKDSDNAISEMLSVDLINWKMIPPRSPHFGGLWESCVKSAKTHLKRVIGNAILTFEELSTLMTQIEAILNSRPLTPISHSPDDLTFLTPGHFLIGDSLTALPQSNLLDLKQNRLSRYQLLTQMIQHFWNRWSLEYLTNLQQRHKWFTQNHQTIKVGDMVLIKDDQLPPFKWSLGQVQELFPGSDGISRVVNVKTSRGLVKRAIRKLCPLPFEEH